MKLPNGFGSVYKLKDKPRRKPWMAIRTMRWDIDEEKRTSRQVKSNWILCHKARSYHCPDPLQ